MTEHNRNYILELFKIVSTTSILVVDQYGRVKRLNCPFRVVAFENIPPHISEGYFYMVEAVKMDLELREVFLIKGKGYLIKNFRIVARL